jgi:hypothetical protein
MRFPGRGLGLGVVLVATLAEPAVAAEGVAPEGACVVTSWTATWGVKESFRSYLSGAIANGEWSTAGNVTYNTPDFTISGESGWLSPDGSAGELDAEGSIRFYGHGGILDQTLSSPHLLVGDNIFLAFDVVGDTREGVSVNQDAVPFVSVDGTPDVDSSSSTWSLVDVPTTLTEAGAEAFGNYPAGTDFDPITLTAEVEPGCLTKTSSPLAWVVSLSVLASALGAGVTVWVRRRRGQERPTPQES